MEKNIENGDTKNLLIIGNGFDLARDLPTSFYDYIDKYDGNNFQEEKNEFNKFLEYIYKQFNYNDFAFPYFEDVKNLANQTLFKFNEINSLSFWDMHLLTKKFINEKNENKLINSNWSDIESEILHFFTYKNHYLSFSDLLKKHISIKDNTEIDEKNLNKLLKFELIINRFIYCFLYINNISRKEYYSFLFDQLNRFELNFSNYLLDKINYDSCSGMTSEGIEIIDSRDNLVNKIFEDIKSKKFNLLDFNYDGFKNENLDKETHIHGSINKGHHKPIIIGIDSSGITPDQPIYRFTKTYRIMEQSFGDPVKIIDKNIKNIFFYGHSLAPADYSYFNAIFDSLDLYNSDVTLTFCYTIYDPKKSEELKSNQMGSISKLIYKYGTTLQNSHGDNLLHKMLLENRLRLKEIAI